MKQRAVVFGLGSSYQSIRHSIRVEYNIVGLTDNNTDTVRKHEGVAPSEIIGLDFDIVIITSLYKAVIADISKQLTAIGIPKSKIKSTYDLPIIAVGNGILDVSAITVLGKKFFCVVDSESSDFVSNFARRGLLSVPPGLLGLFNQPGVFLDIGANIGMFSLMFALHGWDVFSFEAGAKNSELLRKSAALNDLCIQVIESAVRDKTGQVYFVQAGSWGHVVDAIPSDNQFYETVDCICLDDWDHGADVTKIDFIKMDIEGSEFAAIRGGLKFLEKFDFPPIYMEVNSATLCVSNESPVLLCMQLLDLGYEMYIVNEESLVPVKPNILLMTVLNDILFVKNARTVFPNISVEANEPTDCPNDKVVEHVVERLSNQDAWFSDITVDSVQEYSSFVCYVLKDMPEYNAHPTINKLLRGIAESVDYEKYNHFTKMATSWLRCYKTKAKQKITS